MKKLFNKGMLALLMVLSLLTGTTAYGDNRVSGEPPAQVLVMNNNVASMTAKRVFQVSFHLPNGEDLKKISWTYGGKPLSEWKTFEQRDYTGPSFITVSQEKVEGGLYSASITFDLPYGSDNLAEPRLQRQLFGSLMGTYELAAISSDGQILAKAPVKLTPYESFLTYDELKPAIDAVTSQAAVLNDRYIHTETIGKSVEGRDIYLTIVAKDKKTVDKYQNVTHPAMMNNPKQLQADIKSGVFGEYAVPVWLNNIHPNESPGVDAIFNYFKSLALESRISYNTTLPDGDASETNMNIDDVLKKVFFLLVYTDNPDGRFHTSRVNANDFDLNRDNTYQTQPETRSVTEQIAKWSPLSFLDLHGFDKNFLIEPATPPHDPNIEYDLLMNSMLEQAKAMGEAGIANTKYDYYHIPYEEHKKSVLDPKYISKGTASGWDDASPAYTAVFAMHHGALGHTLEMPENNEESVKAIYYSVAAATSYVMDNQDKLFMNQLKIYERGIDNLDDHAVDKYLVDARNEEIGRPRKGNTNFFPEYYVLPVEAGVQKNALEVYHMIEYFLRNGVQIERSTEQVRVGGMAYPAGSFVVNMHQAMRGLANLVLYDGVDLSDAEWVTAEIVQNFPDLRGFNCYAIRQPDIFTGKTQPVTSVTMSGTTLPGNTGYVVIHNTNNDAIRAVNELLSSGKTVTMLTAGTEKDKAGDFIVSYQDLKPLLEKYLLDADAFGKVEPKGQLLKHQTIAALGEPEIVLKGLGFEVTADQKKADILVNTFDSEELVRSGKPYVAYGYMGMTNVKNLIPGFAFAGPEWESYEGVFMADVMQDNIITGPYNAQENFYTVSGSYITAVPKAAKVLATISGKNDFYKAGWWPGHAAAKGKILAFTYNENNKHLSVFANDLINKAHSQHQYRLLANSIFNAAGIQPATVPVVKFGDLNGVESWAGDSIRELLDLGALQGSGGERFKPLQHVTRAEYLAMLIKTFDLSEAHSAISFTDVPSSSWYYPYIASAVGAKLVNGVGEGRFEPDRAVTRQEMALIAANVLKHSSAFPLQASKEALEKFTDREAIAPYAREAVAVLSDAHIIEGLSPTVFAPQEIANRAQAAVMISRIRQLYY
ncbi:S-layer homology domain-containing protein [Paenibacillus sp. MMS20-IR301]|uniref:S-layer homology domain-containing protein n=1 Tax=Paenibacillus sp. MMS20-IR301 TaxID=2895946 RepID=UPI0028E34DDB|nr:S-layer homology domain-containing protein [Paenibacillus sp. MMS20-IR301]WNS46095.1 S-layer homology domain-containing protein [Paenibacillus sp. MMS20-IR301]